MTTKKGILKNEIETSGYVSDKLKEYIKFSELRVVNKSLKVRLSDELAKKYDSGAYGNSIRWFEKYIDQIEKLGFQYPGNAHPVFYVYIVPDENFVELLQYPYETRKGGGKPVMSYNLDGFSSAYGVSQNICANASDNPSISTIVNNIHEFSHLVHSQFFNKDRFICEGFAEVVPLFTMGYELKFDEHRNAIKKMTLSQLFSAKELITLARENKFRGNVLVPDRSCSFDLFYISSYLFVRVCIEKISNKFKLSKNEATQKFLEIIRKSRSINEWLVLDLSDELGIPRDMLLYEKELQFKTLETL